MANTDAAKIRFILITGFLNTLGIGLIQPVMPALLMDLTGQPLVDASFWSMVATFAYAVPQFVCTPIIGALSDAYGRRPVLLVSLAAFAVDMMLLGLAWSVTAFIMIRAFAGVFSATFSTANAYIADITPAEERGGRFALFGAAFGLGFICGPALGGLLGEFDPRAPFYAAAILAGLTTLYGYFVATESLAPENRRRFEWLRANAIGTLVTVSKIPGAGMLLVVSFFATLSTWVYVTVWAYVAIAKFNWSEAAIGYSITYYGVIAFVSQAFLVPRMIKQFGISGVIILATIAEAISLFGIGFSSSGFMMYGFITLALISAAQSPAVQQALSSRVPANAQGELQGGVSVLNSLAIVIAPLLYLSLFYQFAQPEGDVFFPGMPFIVASAISVITLLLYLSDQRKKIPEN